MSACGPDCIRPGIGTRLEHCKVCHQTFSGTSAGDMHETGEHGVREGPNRRRCLTPDEMRALRTHSGNPRLVQNSRGVWHVWRSPENVFWEKLRSPQRP